MNPHPVHRRKKLIEVAIPLEAINAASAREKSIRHGHPSTLHLWWARRPLAAARAVIFCQMVDDPSAVPEEFPTEKEQEVERERLFDLIKKLVLWESTDDEKILEPSREEIRRSWLRCCADNANHPEAAELFNPVKLPGFHDPFAGGGALPLEAQRLGLESYASDLNPVAVLINKAMIELPFAFKRQKPVCSDKFEQGRLDGDHFPNLFGLVTDLRHYGNEVLGSVSSKISKYYNSDEDKKPRGERVVAWIWAKTVMSPNPAFSSCMVPLMQSYYLAKSSRKTVYLRPWSENNEYGFDVVEGIPDDPVSTSSGTKQARGANFKCILSGDPITPSYLKRQALSGKLGKRLIVKVVEHNRGRDYRLCTDDEERLALSAPNSWSPQLEISYDPRKGANTAVLYGLRTFGDLFTERQLLALNTISDSILDVRQQIVRDCLERQGWTEEMANAYSSSICIYLSFALGKVADRGSVLCSWNAPRETIRSTFGRQAIAMTWDFVESNPISTSSGGFSNAVDQIIKSINLLPASAVSLPGKACQANAIDQHLSNGKVISTDPPYYDNIGYSDLSDFFYVWLRRVLRQIDDGLPFGTMSAPKSEELIVQPTRHDSAFAAEQFFLVGMTEAMRRISIDSHPALPKTVYYAFKQSEATSEGGMLSTGWETFLEAVIRSGLIVTGTWPLRTERGSMSVGIGVNALASSLVLVCQKRDGKTDPISRNDFRRRLRIELPLALARLEASSIAPVDVVQAAIGPGMAIFSATKAILNADDSPMTVREALVEINAALDEYLSQDEGELDADSRFALTFFESFGYQERDYGDAEGLAVARNISVGGVAKAGILRSVAGKVKLLQRSELLVEWDPFRDKRLCVWEATQQLIKRLEADGEDKAGELLLQLKSIAGHGDLAANCRALAYRLYNHCEKTKQAEEARAYNGLVIAWPELERRAAAASTSSTTPLQTSLI
jgi:putative DNA methylase